GALERPQEPAEVAGVEPEPRPQGPHVAAALGDLPQDPRRPERQVAGQVPVVQRPDPLGHRAVEAADRADHRPLHFSDFSQRSVSSPARSSTAIAALRPPMPLTPPPRRAPAPQTTRLATSVSTPHAPGRASGR